MGSSTSIWDAGTSAITDRATHIVLRFRAVETFGTATFSHVVQSRLTEAALALKAALGVTAIWKRAVLLVGITFAALEAHLERFLVAHIFERAAALDLLPGFGECIALPRVKAHNLVAAPAPSFLRGFLALLAEFLITDVAFGQASLVAQAGSTRINRVSSKASRREAYWRASPAIGCW